MSKGERTKSVFISHAVRNESLVPSHVEAMIVELSTIHGFLVAIGSHFLTGESEAKIPTPNKLSSIRSQSTTKTGSLGSYSQVRVRYHALSSGFANLGKASEESASPT